MKQRYEIIIKSKSKWWNLDIFGIVQRNGHCFGYIYDNTVTIVGDSESDMDLKLWSYVDEIKEKHKFNEMLTSFTSRPLRDVIEPVYNNERATSC